LQPAPHGLSTMRNAGLILVLDQGQLVEQGRFDELTHQGDLVALLAEGGKFAPDSQPVSGANMETTESLAMLD